MRRVISREQRAASASFGIVVVTAMNCFLFHYGYRALAGTNELCTALVYAIWVKLGKPESEIQPDDESPMTLRNQ